MEAGGRTGLTALTTAVMFLACIFIAPIAAIIPAAATSSALIYVGILMLQGLKNVDFNDLDQIVPCSSCSSPCPSPALSATASVWP